MIVQVAKQDTQLRAEAFQIEMFRIHSIIIESYFVNYENKNHEIIQSES